VNVAVTTKATSIIIASNATTRDGLRPPRSAHKIGAEKWKFITTTIDIYPRQGHWLDGLSNQA
jgi:hypothetical protein